VPIRTRLEDIAWLRLLVKRLKVWREYACDARHFCANFLDANDPGLGTEYEIRLIAHSIEKGLSHDDPRPFGLKKAHALVDALGRAERLGLTGNSAYSLGLGALAAWMHSQRAIGVPAGELEFADGFLGRADLPHALPAGTLRVARDHDWSELPLRDFLSARHSARRFTASPVPEQVVLDCVEMALTSPSACNRQLIHFFCVEEETARRRLYDTLHGTGGVDFEQAHLGVITYDVSSLGFYGERNQGYLNAGLFAMSLVLAFHWKGLGSCLLQVGNSYAQERALAEALGLPPNHRLAVAVAYGYPREEEVVPASVRKPPTEVCGFLR